MAAAGVKEAMSASRHATATAHGHPVDTGDQPASRRWCGGLRPTIRSGPRPSIGYLPLERQAANLLFALVARRYERGSIIVTSNRGFEAWGEILGDAMVAAALIDRLIHHAHMVTLKGKSYRLRERASGAAPAVHAPGLRPSARTATTSSPGALFAS